jgi:hypothetical protein
MKKLLTGIAITAVALMLAYSADAATIRCGSSWQICAERGKGPGRPTTVPRQLNNVRRGLIQPNTTQPK